MKDKGLCFWRITKLSVLGLTILMLFTISPFNVANCQETFVKKLSVNPNTRIASSDFTAICISYPKKLYDLIVLQIGEKSYELKPEEHAITNDTVFMSQLIAFDAPKNSFTLQTNMAFEGAITAFLIHPPQLAIPAQKQKADGNCDEPPMMLQTEWRQGLPDPDYQRIPNRANNLIIHHSATDNELTDYTALVRSIYVYHTEVNGWSDIGYNYLIAPNGQIYAGRDPGPVLAQDAVLGAHFCASNTGTMGVCVLGNYELAAPSNDAIVALLDLLAWKTAKDTMNPLAFVPHPLNNELGVIAGHRDGCATSCPGIHLYDEIPNIKSGVVEILHSCGLFPGTAEQMTHESTIKLFPNPICSEKLFVQSEKEPIVKVTAFDMLGNNFILFEASNNTENKKVELEISLDPAFYLIRTETHNNIFVSKLLVTQ